MPGLDLMILVDQVEQVQLLALVLMQTLGLDVEHCIRVNGDALRAVQPVGQCALVLRLDGGELLQNIDIFRVGQQFFELGGVLAEAGTDELFDLGGQCRVALQQPAAEGDAVGLIVEFFGVELVKAVQLAVFQDLGVQMGNAVRRVGEVDVHVGHVNAVITVDDGQTLVGGAGAGQRVELFNDGHELRHDGVQIGAGPLFERLGQNGVVRVGTGLCDDLDGLVKVDALLPQQADQLGDNHAGVGVVDLDGGVVGQIVVITAAGGALGQNQLGPGGNHQVLLVDAQTASGLIGVIGIQEKRQVFVDVGLVERDAVVDDALINGVEIEQIQRVRAALVARDGQLVQTGAVGLAGQLDGIDRIRFFRPGVGGQPRVGQLVLDAVLEGLAEQTEVIPQADTVAGQVQRGEGVKETGGQTAQPAVAKAWLRLDLLNIGQVFPGSGQRGAGVVVQP